MVFYLTKNKWQYMAKKSSYLIRMQSTESAHFFIRKKARNNMKIDKLRLRKYDPIVRRHVIFEEKKMHSHSAK